MMEVAIDRWEKYNKYLGETVYHGTGVLCLKQSKIEEGSFEWNTQKLLRSRGHKIETITPELLKKRYPMWNSKLYVDGHFNPRGGYAESGRVVQLMAKKAAEYGVVVKDEEARQILIENGKAIGVLTMPGNKLLADITVVSAGAWTPTLIPHLREMMVPNGQIIFHFMPEKPKDFAPEVFPTYFADINKTGFYGFPAHPSDGRVKLGHHSTGVNMTDITPAGISNSLQLKKEQAERTYRKFILQTFPKLGDSPTIFSRLCLYCDTFDGDFVIDYDPYVKNLVIAAGGSGHGFKFGPVLGDLIADVVERKPNRWAKKFRYRPVVKGLKEQSRNAEADLSVNPANL